ncbi:unnamed protein product [Caenorhabditis brenneri]
MSFDPDNPDTTPVSPKIYKYKSSLEAQHLMCLVLDSDDITRATDYIKDFMENPPKIDETQKVRPEEMWELKEIEKEIMEETIVYRRESEEYLAKIYASKFHLLTNWIVFFFAIYYLYSHVLYESDVDERILGVNNVLLAVSFFIYFLTFIDWFRYTPLDDNETLKLNKHYEKLKTELKPEYTAADILQEQKNVLDLFLNDFVTAKSRNMDIVERHDDLKIKAGLPIFLYMLCVILFFLVKGIIKEGDERKSGLVCALVTFLLSIALLIPVLTTTII